MLRPALARRMALRRRSVLPDIWLAWLRLMALVGLALVLVLLLFGEKARAEESVREIEVATADDPPTTGALPAVGAAPEALEEPVERAPSRIAARPGAPTGCLPDALKDVVADVAARFGPVSIESTHRGRTANRRKGGAPRSLHIACRAIDFRVASRGRAVMAYLRTRPEVGGLKMYRTGIIHIDNGERRRW